MPAALHPTLATGKICYIEIPATDIDRSAEFYERAFGWQIRRGDDGSVAFDDAVGEVSGTWVPGRPPSSEPGLMIHIMVGDAVAVVDAVGSAGGEIVQPLDPDAPEQVARFRDPGGNVLGIYQQPGLAGAEAKTRASAEPGRPAGGDTTVDPIPGHLHAVTPRLVVSDGAGAIEFYRSAFGAEEVGERFTGPEGGIVHAQVQIGDSIVMITDELGHPEAVARSPQSLAGIVSAVMATYWEDVDAAWERAVGAGAEVVYPLADHFYGERGGRLRDPYGQQWMLSQRTEDLPHEEITRRAALAR